MSASIKKRAGVGFTTVLNRCWSVLGELGGLVLHQPLGSVREQALVLLEHLALGVLQIEDAFVLTGLSVHRDGRSLGSQVVEGRITHVHGDLTLGVDDDERRSGPDAVESAI